MRKLSARTWHLLAAAYAATLAAVRLLPSGEGPLGDWDASISATVRNVLHVPAHVVLAVLICLAFETRAFGKAAAFGIASCSFGGLQELAQAAVPGRTASLEDDALSNVVGAAAGCFRCLGWKMHESGILRPEEANSWGR